MAFTNPGTNVTTRITFNSGTIDFGANRIVEVDNVTVTTEFTIAYLYVLGSIVGQDIVRHSLKVTMTGKVKSWGAEIDMLALGSSTTGTPQEIDVLDGQPTLLSPVCTFFDRNNKEVQYQLQGALFKSDKASLRAEEFGEYDFEINAKNIAEVYTA